MFFLVCFACSYFILVFFFNQIKLYKKIKRKEQKVAKAKPTTKTPRAKALTRKVARRPHKKIKTTRKTKRLPTHAVNSDH